MANDKIEYWHNIALLKDDSHFGPWIKQAGRLDHDQWLLQKILPFIPKDGVVVDAGAYIGDHTIAYLKKVGSQGRVFAFEPNKDAFECLHHNMGGAENVGLFNAGLSDKREKIGIEFCGNNYGMAHLTGDGEIECMTLDEVFPAGCDFIKLDVEGFELKALNGAKAAIAQFKPVMLIEMNSATLQRQNTTYEEIFAFLDSMGYDYRNIDDTGDLTPPQYDLLCTPQKK